MRGAPDSILDDVVSVPQQETWIIWWPHSFMLWAYILIIWTCFWEIMFFSASLVFQIALNTMRPMSLSCHYPSEEANHGQKFRSRFWKWTDHIAECIFRFLHNVNFSFHVFDRMFLSKIWTHLTFLCTQSCTFDFISQISRYSNTVAHIFLLTIKPESLLSV